MTDNQKPTLSDEDKQRIEQQNPFLHSIYQSAWQRGAEYATIYERGQKAKELGEAPENVNYGSPEHLKYVIRKLKAEKEKLEAERTELQELIKNLHLKVGQERQEKEAQRLAAIELRNKVIEECVDALFNAGFDPTLAHYSKIMFGTLNSLKK